MKNIHCNYDIEQCNWLLKNGFKANGCGIHSKTNNTYLCFTVSKAYKDACKYYDEYVRIS